MTQLTETSHSALTAFFCAILAFCVTPLATSNSVGSLSGHFSNQSAYNVGQKSAGALLVLDAINSGNLVASHSNCPSVAQAARPPLRLGFVVEVADFFLPMSDRFTGKERWAREMG